MTDESKPDAALRACAEAPAQKEGKVQDDQSRSETPEISQPLQSSAATAEAIRTQQCGICGAFIVAGEAGECKKCGTEWKNR